jgi:dTDP-glucose 4,6-dehydratase/UDP-glucuronate decarboxylase
MHSAVKFLNTIDKRAKILITGASGLIGSNLLKILIEAQRICDRNDVNIYAHVRPSAKINIDPSKNFKTIVADEIKIPEGMKFDAIFHLATYGQPGKFAADPISTLQLNSSSLFDLTKSLKNDGIFYFASSSEIYSGNPNIPHVETEAGYTNTTHPRSMYIEAKRFGETYCFWQAENGRRFYSGRIALAYGPGTMIDDQRVLNQLIVRGLTDRKIALRDDGSAIRQYCYVDDTIDIIFRQINDDHRSPLNVCGTSIVTIKDLAGEIASKLKVELSLGATLSVMEGAPQLVRSSTKKIEQLGKTDYIPLSIGLSKVIDWYNFLLQK